MPNRNVLIIDDDTLLCSALSRRFSYMGINAFTASTGKDGLTEVKEKKFDIIFLELNLPDINGIELLDKIQELSLLSKLIVISAEINEDYRSTAIRKGAVDFIEKPFGFSDIKKLMNSIFSEDMEKRESHRFTCNISCNISVIGTTEAVEEESRNNGCMSGTAVDINKKGLGLKFNNDIAGIAKGKLVLLLTGVRDCSIFDFLPSNIVAEIVWVKKQDREILAGLKYLQSTDDNIIPET